VLFGSQTVQPTADSNGAGSAQIFQVADSTSGTASSITIYLSSNDAASNLIAGIYTDNNGQPGTLLASGSIASPQAGAWDTVPITPTSLSTGTYWLAFLSSGGPLYFRDLQSGTCTTQTSASTSLSSLPSSWTTGGIWNNEYCPVSAYVAGTASGTTTITTPTQTTTTPTGTTTTPTQTTTTPTGGPPTGVTTQPIDGGPNYYCSNGFTYACNAGWDNPSFIPILDTFAFYPANSALTFKSMGFNTTLAVTGGTGGSTTCASGAMSLSVLKAAGIWADLSQDSNCNVGTETVMAHIEEPCGWSGSCMGNGPITSQASTLNSMFNVTGRPLEAVFTWQEFANPGMSGDPCGSTTMQSAMTCTSGMPSSRHLDIPTADIYWFAGDPSAANYSRNYCGTLYNGGSDCSQAQVDEASHYGDMVDAMRRWINGNGATGTPGTAPTAPYIETDDGLCNSCRPINPNELNWAAWDTIIHGARMLIWFGATQNTSTFGFSPTPQTGFTVSDATQGTDTNTLVENLAPIINAPFAIGYASGSNGGYTFPTPDGDIGSDRGVLGTGNQLDLMTKYYTGGLFANSSGTFGNGYYIFVTGRGTETTTNVPVTLTLPSSVANQSVNVIDSSTGAPSRTTVSVSSHQISFTLAHDYDTYIIGPIS
jgi:hypothetical protein